MSGTRLLCITVVHAAAPRGAVELQMELPDGATLQAALDTDAVREAFASADTSAERVGVWGRKASAQQRLRDGDRIELYRPLLVDPKVARRERFAKQGARTTGLFAKKRAGAKAGY